MVKADEPPESASFLELLGSPAGWDGKRVRVIGFAHVQFEGQGLYFHREDFENLLTKNALWVDVDIRRPEFAALNDRYVIVEGTFNATKRGHMALYAGALTGISRYDPCPTRAQAEEQLKAGNPDSRR